MLLCGTVVTTSQTTVTVRVYRTLSLPTISTIILTASVAGVDHAPTCNVLATMADFSFSDDRELQQLNQQVLDDPEEFEHWEKLVRTSESQEGGLNRNSSPGAIAATRDVYDRFLARFPLFFGYWKKYADLEFTIAGTEAAEMVYERGVASIGISVDLWANYCGFKTETSHDVDVIRDLFERGADSVGLDFLAHPFWDRYIEFEERLDAHDRIFQILSRVIHIPMHQYARYFERYRTMAAQRAVSELVPEEKLNSLRQETSGMKRKSDADLDVELRKCIDAYHMDIFNKTQSETTKRWTYESEVKRPYYHVTELDEPQLANWRKYLDFEEAEGDYTRVRFLYERCLVTAANYDEFWFRYARWMLVQDREQEVRNIYQRASCVYVPIARPSIRLFYAQFEESMGYPAIALEIHDAILAHMPDHLETIISMSGVQRRQNGVDAALECLRQRAQTLTSSSPYTAGALVAEQARLVAEAKGQPDEARQIYQSNQAAYSDCRPFWLGWFFFEVKQPFAGPKEQAQHYERVKAVYNTIRRKSQLPSPVIRDVTSYYLLYLRERGSGSDAIKELMQLDAEVNGPSSVQQKGTARKPDDLDMTAPTNLQSALQNGHATIEAHQSLLSPGQPQIPVDAQAY
ncbi:MRNA processing protein [Teratosphaeria nubilosa]|uniref:mRNA processing protein n=1 Tax=Teratosphaeria nubilosa TaxID=161662 RepID=A0A6G1KW52_9PEZI|nr:MRNA processing protein [Teratosphaeria nubilosa]